MRLLKKITALTLCTAMILAAVPASIFDKSEMFVEAQAEYIEVPADAIEISSAQDFYNYANEGNGSAIGFENSSLSFVLTNDIIINSSGLNNSRNTERYMAADIFGNGHKLLMEGSDYWNYTRDDWGLFHEVGGAIYDVSFVINSGVAPYDHELYGANNHPRLNAGYVTSYLRSGGIIERCSISGGFSDGNDIYDSYRENQFRIIGNTNSSVVINFGFFTSVSYGTINDVHIDDIAVTVHDERNYGYLNVGGVAAVIYSGRISNVMIDNADLTIRDYYTSFHYNSGASTGFPEYSYNFFPKYLGGIFGLAQYTSGYNAPQVYGVVFDTGDYDPTISSAGMELKHLMYGSSGTSVYMGHGDYIDGIEEDRIKEIVNVQWFGNVGDIRNNPSIERYNNLYNFDEVVVNDPSGDALSFIPPSVNDYDNTPGYSYAYDISGTWLYGRNSSIYSHIDFYTNPVAIIQDESSPFIDENSYSDWYDDYDGNEAVWNMGLYWMKTPRVEMSALAANIANPSITIDASKYKSARYGSFYLDAYYEEKGILASPEWESATVAQNSPTATVEVYVREILSGGGYGGWINLSNTDTSPTQLVTGASYEMRAAVSGSGIDENDISINWVRGTTAAHGEVSITQNSGAETVLAITGEIDSSAEIIAELTASGSKTTYNNYIIAPNLPTLANNVDYSDAFDAELGNTPLKESGSSSADFELHDVIIPLDGDGNLTSIDMAEIELSFVANRLYSGTGTPLIDWSVKEGYQGVSIAETSSNAATLEIDPSLWDADNTIVTAVLELVGANNSKKTYELPIVIIKAMPSVYVNASDTKTYSITTESDSIPLSREIAFAAGSGADERVWQDDFVTGLGILGLSIANATPDDNVTLTGTNIAIDAIDYNNSANTTANSQSVDIAYSYTPPADAITRNVIVPITGEETVDIKLTTMTTPQITTTTGTTTITTKEYTNTTDTTIVNLAVTSKESGVTTPWIINGADISVTLSPTDNSLTAIAPTLAYNVTSGQLSIYNNKNKTKAGTYVYNVSATIAEDGTLKNNNRAYINAPKTALTGRLTVIVPALPTKTAEVQNLDTQNSTPIPSYSPTVNNDNRSLSGVVGEYYSQLDFGAQTFSGGLTGVFDGHIDKGNGLYVDEIALSFSYSVTLPTLLDDSLYYRYAVVSNTDNLPDVTMASVGDVAKNANGELVFIFDENDLIPNSVSTITEKYTGPISITEDEKIIVCVDSDDIYYYEHSNTITLYLNNAKNLAKNNTLSMPEHGERASEERQARTELTVDAASGYTATQSFLTQRLTAENDSYNPNAANIASAMGRQLPVVPTLISFVSGVSGDYNYNDQYTTNLAVSLQGEILEPAYSPTPNGAQLELGDSITLRGYQPNTDLFFTISTNSTPRDIDTGSAGSTPFGFEQVDVDETLLDSFERTYYVLGTASSAPSIQIPFYYEADTLTINAVARSKDDVSDVSDPVSATYNLLNRAPIDAPTLFLQSDVDNSPIAYNTNDKYAKSGLTLFFRDLTGSSYDSNEYTIYYNIGRNVETPNATTGTLYDDTAGVLVPEDMKNFNNFEVKVYMEHVSGINSTAEYEIAFLGGYADAEITQLTEQSGMVTGFESGEFDFRDISDGGYVTDDSLITLKIHESDIPDDMKATTYPDSYEYDINNNLQLIQGVPQERLELVDQLYSAPQITYALVDVTGLDEANYPVWGSLAVDQINDYREAQPNLYLRQGDIINFTPETESEQIDLSAYSAGDKVALMYRITGNDAEKSGEPETVILTIQAPADPPTITRSGIDDEENPLPLTAPLSVGEELTLRPPTTLQTAEIYYSLHSKPITREMVEAAQLNYQNSNYLPDPDDENVLTRYTGTPLKVPFVELYTLQAVAVSPLAATGETKSMSSIAGLSLTLEPLPEAEKPTAEPVSGETMAKNEMIVFTTTTQDAYIYYTVNGGTPNPTEYEAAANSQDPEAELAKINTKRILPGESIKMIPAANGQCRIQALTAQIISQDTTVRPSSVATFTYTLEKASMPTSNPPTLSTAPVPDGEDPTPAAVLPPGTQIRLLSSVPNSVIYYAEGSAIPIVPENGVIPETDIYTKLYDPTVGLVMPEIDYIVTAIQVSNDHDSLAVYADSDQVTFTFTVTAPVTAPTFSPPGGDVVSGRQLLISAGTDESTQILYRIIEEDDSPEDELTPQNGLLYDPESPIIIDRAMTVEAIAERDGAYSKVTTHSYELAEKLDNVESSLSSGSIVYQGQMIELDAESGSTIIYTKDDSDPTDPENKALIYGNEVIIDAKPEETVTIRAYSTETGRTPSDVAVFTYTVSSDDDLLRATPSADNVVRNGTTVSLSTAVSGGEIYYTTDGDDPAQDGRRGNTVTLDGTPGETITIKAVVASEDADSDENASVPKVFTYTLMGKSIPPSASIQSGAVALRGAQVALISSSPTAAIYYTTNGMDPTTSSSFYTEPLTINSSVVIKAIVVEEDKEASDVATYIYTYADDVAAPSSSEPSGIIEQGTAIRLSTNTDGATIYYTTSQIISQNYNLATLTPYTGPITITRPATISMIAIKDGMNPSAVNTVSYTVTEPPEPEVEEDTTTQLQTSGTNQLETMRTYATQPEGPAFSDIQLQETVHMSIISGEEGSIPQTAKIVTEVLQTTEEEKQAVKAANGDFEVVKLYDVTLQTAEGEVQPSSQIEVGLPIPPGYENTIVQIARIRDDGSVEFLETRRSGGIAYAMVDSLDKYAIAVPTLEESSGISTEMIILSGTAGVALLAGTGTVFAIRRRKLRGKGEIK